VGSLELAWQVALPDFAHALAFAPGGAILGAATLAGPIVFLDARSGDTLWTAPGHAGGALSLAWSPDGRWVATGGQDARVGVLDPRAREVVAELAAPGGWVSHVAWSPDGSLLACASGARVWFWSSDWIPLGEPVEHASSVTALFFHPEAGWATACYGGLQLLEPGAQRPRERHAYRGSVIVAAACPDGSMVALGSQDACVRVWDRRQRNDAQLTGYPGKVSVIAWSEQGPTLATAGGKEAILWACGGYGPRGTTPARLERHTARISSLIYVDGGRRLVSSGLDGCLGVWDGDKAWQSTDWIETSRPIHALVDAGDALAAASAGGQVSVWRH
jgi:WD40 repeat protein